MQYVGTTYRLIQGEGLWGLSPVKSIDFKGFKAPTGPEPIPPLEERKTKLTPPPLDTLLKTLLERKLREESILLWMWCIRTAQLWNWFYCKQTTVQGTKCSFQGGFTPIGVWKRPWNHRINWSRRGGFWATIAPPL